MLIWHSVDCLNTPKFWSAFHTYVSEICNLNVSSPTGSKATFPTLNYADLLIRSAPSSLAHIRNHQSNLIYPILSVQQPVISYHYTPTLVSHSTCNRTSTFHLPQLCPDAFRILRLLRKLLDRFGVHFSASADSALYSRWELIHKTIRFFQRNSRVTV